MKEKEVQAIKSKEKIKLIALEEFANKGYKMASTNVICKKANISKGLLYHYYSSKEELYLDIIRSIIDTFKENVTLKNNDTNKKGIDYVSEYFNIKFKFFRDNPLYSKLITGLLLCDDVDGIRRFIEEFENHNNSIIYKILESISINPKFDKGKAFELIVMVGDKLEEKYLKHIQNTDEDKNEILEKFREEHKLMIQMIFEGIDQ